MKQLWEILVPANFNNKKKIPVSYHRIWDKKVRNLSGGLTIMKGVKGSWVFSNKVYTEKMLPVRIFCTSKQIEEIADFTAKHYSQLAIMFYKISSQVRIKHYRR